MPHAWPVLNRSDPADRTEALSEGESIPAWVAENPLLLLGLFLLCLFICFALLAPWIAPHDPAALNLSRRLHSPSGSSPFGTDELGRDILSRIVYGARISITVGFAVVSLSLLFGVAVGALSGFYGGLMDTVLNVYVANAFLALPGILLAIAFVDFMGQ